MGLATSVTWGSQIDDVTSLQSDRAGGTAFFVHSDFVGTFGTDVRGALDYVGRVANGHISC